MYEITITYTPPETKEENRYAQKREIYSQTFEDLDIPSIAVFLNRRETMPAMVLPRKEK
jgi:hypothetical protein